uniref:Carboxylic ester hydrolase n=1 Tax=Pandalus japonicus TaxID=666362 RepID=F5A5Q7_PANJP|nr:JHE-like carboxylesterase 2 [Pandalus japonicus]
MKLLFLHAIAFGFQLIVCAGELEAPVISTEEGNVAGVVEEASNGKPFHSYYGIPYATPPVGELRFKDPVPANKWKGVRDGSSMPSPCPEVPYGAAVMGIKLTAKELPGKEDCLYLNVFKPKAAQPSEGDFPVMVYIHGGGYFAGGAEEYLPHVLMSKDIILVVIQYRLGFLGFLSTEDSVMPGNYGLKDQTLALQWVQKNIQNFGGDPKRVTIFGESAGSASVHYHMLSPKTKGLFSGAIMQSGSAFASWASSKEHKKTAKKVGSLVGCNLEEGSQPSQVMHCDRARSMAPELSSVILPSCSPESNETLPDDQLEYAVRRYNRGQTMIGVTANEGAALTQPLYGVRRNLMSELEKGYPVLGPLSIENSLNDNDSLRLANHIYNYYLGGVNLDIEHAEDMTKMISDVHFNLGFDLVSQLHSRATGESTFRYELGHRGQMSFGDFTTVDVGRHWVPHVDDLYYLFRGGPMLTPVEQPPERPTDLEAPEDLAVRNFMVTLWTNFAAHGHPTPDKSLGFVWEATNPDNLRHLALTPNPSMKGDARKEVRRFLLSLPTETNLILNPNLITENTFRTGSKRRNQDEL